MRDSEENHTMSRDTVSARATTPADSSSVGEDLRGTARQGAVTFVGAAFSTAMGFALSLVLARTLGAVGSGVVLQAIAAFTIGLAVARLGMDTAAVWILPRLKREAPEDVRAAVVALLAPSVVAGTVLSVSWWGAAQLVTGPLLNDEGVTRAVDAAVWAMPFGSAMLVALAATRAFGGVVPFNLIGNVAVPLARPIGVLVVAAMGGGMIAASFVWTLPQVPGVLVALWVLHRQVGRMERTKGVRGRWLPARSLQRRIFGFALPRTLASALEQSTKWFDVVLVGAIAGPAAAGVYGVASRFVSAGIIVLTAFRIVVAPRFSSYLAQRRMAEVQELYAVTASWILLFGAPVYVLLAFFSPTLLGGLGPEFEAGVPSLIVLCAGAVVMLAGGNVQSVLLMSGRSGWGAVNKATVFGVNVVADLILVPQIGYFGAACAWSACMALDAGLAMFQVWRFDGIAPSLGRLAAVATAVTGCVAVPSLVCIWLLGNSWLGLVVAAALGAVLLLGYCRLDRRRLRMAELMSILPTRGRG